MKRCYGMFVTPIMAVIFFCFLLPTVSVAANKVVVIPLSGVSGDALATDVIKGKTFSSRVAGKGVPGMMKIRDGSIIYTNSIGMEFSLIPAGSFVMGSPDGTGDSDHPPVNSEEPGRDSTVSVEKQHTVILTKSFYMQTTEVTQEQWEAVMGAGTNPSHFSNCGLTCPVEMVSWDDANDFIAALNTRESRTFLTCTFSDYCPYILPTEAQWEYAARAGTVTAFYNGDITQPTGNDPNLNDIGWYFANSGNITHPVAQKQSNNWGLYDMSGNVEEWCRDWYDIYLDGPVFDPTGPSSGAYRVIRSGSWANNALSARTANRAKGMQGGRDDDQGFRLVLPSGQ